MMIVAGKIDKRFKQRFAQRFEKYDFQAGIFAEDKDRDHYPARSIYTKSGKKKKKKSAYTVVDGMKARRKGRMLFGDGPKIRDIVAFANKRAGKDIIVSPFQSPNSSSMSRLRKAVTRFFISKNPSSMRKQVEQAMVSVIRDPIRKKQYGSNSRSTIKMKGFNRLLFDTGQMWNAIKAKVVRAKPKSN